MSHATNIISHPHPKVAYEERETVYITNRHGGRATKMPRAFFWALSEKQENKVVTVVIRQVKLGQKHFFSIYDK